MYTEYKKILIIKKMREQILDIKYMQKTMRILRVNDIKKTKNTRIIVFIPDICFAILFSIIKEQPAPIYTRINI